MLEDSFLTNTIPEFDPSPPQVIGNAFEGDGTIFMMEMIKIIVSNGMT